MYGWRARIGAIVGKRNAVCEPELSRMVPRGVCVYAARTGTHTKPSPKTGKEVIGEVAIYDHPEVMKEVKKSAGRRAADLSGVRPDVVVFTHNVASMASVSFNQELTKEMAGQAG